MRTCTANTNPTRLGVGASCHCHPFLLIAALFPLRTVLHSLQSTQHPHHIQVSRLLAAWEDSPDN